MSYEIDNGAISLETEFIGHGDYACMMHMVGIEEENALLTKKLAGLENIDDNKGSLIKIIEGAIEDFDGLCADFEANDLRKKLDEAIK